MASVSDRPRNRLHNRLADRALEILSRVCLFVRQTDQRHSFFLFRRFKAASGSGSKRDTPFANIRRSNFCAVLLSCSSGSSSSTLQGGDCQVSNETRGSGNNRPQIAKLRSTDHLAALHLAVSRVMDRAARSAWRVQARRDRWCSCQVN